MEKVICIYRTSTDRQEIEAQKKEVISMALSDGYKQEEIKLIGNQGASAIKLDNKYLKQMENIYNTIEAGGIECVYAWAIDRIGRNEEVLMKFKNILIDNKVQLKINSVSTPLFDRNGKVDRGFELVYSFFATMAKQEMEEKQDRFERSKKRNAESGKFNGGVVKYGYSVDDHGYYMINEEEANIVRLIFTETATGHYSARTLTKELQERGIKIKGKAILLTFIQRVLKDTCYCGYANKYKFEKNYPRIISDELYNAVQEVLSKNNIMQNKCIKHKYFATKLLKCNECGHNLTASGNFYRCHTHAERNINLKIGKIICNNEISMNCSTLDGILWSIALKEHFNMLQEMTEEKKAELTKEIGINNDKIKTLEEKIEGIEGRKKKIDTVYLNSDRWTENEYYQQLNLVDRDKDKFQNEKRTLEERNKQLHSIMNEEEDPLNKWFNNMFTITKINHEENEQMMSDIVHKYISKVEITKTVSPNNFKTQRILLEEVEDPNSVIDLSNRNCYLITVTKVDGAKFDLYYFNKTHYNWKVWIRDITGQFIKPLKYEPIIRDNNYATTDSIQLSKNIIKEIEKFVKSDYENRSNIIDFLLFDFLPKYGKWYTGNFDEAGEYKNLTVLYNKMIKMNDPQLQMNLEYAIGKYFEIV